MRNRLRLRIIAPATLLAVLAVALFLLQHGPQRAHHWIVDADGHGALVIDLDAQIVRGLDAVGATVWSAPGLKGTYRWGHCLERCPDAVFSARDPGNLDAPAIVWVQGGEIRRDAASQVDWSPAPALAGPRVLWARSPENAIVLYPRGDDGFLVDVRGGHGPPFPIPVRSARPGVAMSDDGRRGLVVDAASRAAAPEDGSLVYWLERDSDGRWSQRHPPLRGDYRGGCLAPDGGHAVLTGQRTEIVDFADGARRTLTTRLGFSGRCVVGSVGTLLVRRGIDERGSRMSLRYVASDGAATWRRSYSSFLDFDVSRDARFVAIRETAGLVVYRETGEQVLRRSDVDSFTFIDERTLLTVTPDGELERIPLSPETSG